MDTPRPDSRARCGYPGALYWALRLARHLMVSAMLAVSTAGMTPAPAGVPEMTGAGVEVFGANTPLGRLSYYAGQGLRVGETGLVLGGFATAQAERLQGGERQAAVEGLNLFAFYDPLPAVHLFTELELGPLAQWEQGADGVRLNPEVEVERLYLDLGASDTLNLRLGKFLTPFGRWNQAPVEPLTWTTSEPLSVEEVFDETATGAMLHGSLFPRGEALSYALYGAFLDPLDADPEAPPAEHSVGARLEWAGLGGWTAGASYFISEAGASETGASETGDTAWNHLGGVDLLWQHARLEVSGEALFGEGSRENGALTGGYLQAVVETAPTLYLVGRYERFDPPQGRTIDLVDLGLAWVPAPYLRLKADYLFADRRDERAAPGLRMSLSILF